MAYTFEGYLRKDGTVGTRNYIGVVSSVVCSSVIAKEISDRFPKAIPIVHANGCAQLGDDFQLTKNMLVGVASNPNLHSALLVGLGCETNQVSGLLHSIPKTKPVKGIGIQQMAGGENTVNRGVEIIGKWSNEVDEEKRERLPLSNLTVGIVTIDTDEDTLRKVTPVVGGLINLLIQNDATVVMGLSETLEPAGLLLAKRTNHEEVANRLRKLGEGVERKQWKEIKKEHSTVLGFTEEEKTFAILESELTGANPINSLLNYNEKPQSKGLHLSSATTNIVETFSTMASSGCNIVLVVSSRGILTGSIALPCMTISPESKSGAFDELTDYIITEESTDVQVEKLMNELIAISSGKQTSLEKFELGEFSIPHIGTTF
ncbi:UxaA family hydrolase [Sporosarcina sp. BP05]|uniref:UxaA family hydrolase n=1 Tax=Sporosarcina sp. BP05 TaxID=2758726 RepID=UPI0016488610|nr:UxaA family hydrolase [Sporosarcina sp. BP05]